MALPGKGGDVWPAVEAISRLRMTTLVAGAEGVS